MPSVMNLWVTGLLGMLSASCAFEPSTFPQRSGGIDVSKTVITAASTQAKIGRRHPCHASSAFFTRLQSHLPEPAEDVGKDDLNAIWMTARLPTSVDDQVRQATEALKRASQDGKHRHSIRLLLPIIGATELDDWPGGARQMMEAADPLIEQILSGMGAKQFQRSILDKSDGLYAIMAQASEAKDDSCTVLLPSADNIDILKSIDAQVGPERDLVVVNAQWKRKSDFGYFGRDKQCSFVEGFEPSFFCSNLMVDGDQVRILRSYPGPWRVFLLQNSAADASATTNEGDVQWSEIGSKEFVTNKPGKWDNDPKNKRDGGRIFDYGQPSYHDIADMIKAAPGYRQKSYAERAAAAFTFIKDTL